MQNHLSAYTYDSMTLKRLNWLMQVMHSNDSMWISPSNKP